MKIDHESVEMGGRYRRPAPSLRRIWALAVVAGSLGLAGHASAQIVPESLKGVPIPTPSNLNDFVVNKAAAIQLGKALFWDVQVASDGKTSCGTCHFSAGADNRSKNQVGPGFDRVFQLPGANYQLKKTDFPFHKLSDPNNQNSTVLSSIDDTVGSSGAFNETFVSARPGALTDDRTPAGDPLFQVAGIQTRKLGIRNAPTNINAIFNFRNGRAGVPQFLFNGVNRFGARDENARVFKTTPTGVQPVQVRIDNASLASQAVTPPLNILEMTAVGRQFQHIGKRLLAVRPLAQQEVSRSDSVLGPFVHSTGRGLTQARYEDMVKAAFKPEWWNGDQLVRFNADGTKNVIPFSPAPAANEFRQIEANFSLFWGLAVQLYQSTLVSDDTPFDRYVAGNTGALTATQKQGLDLFFGKARCVECHRGAEFTDASVRNTLREPMRRIVTRAGNTAVVDQGFHNNAVRPSAWDVADGERDIAGRPISLPELLKTVGPSEFTRFTGVTPNLTIGSTEALAIRGAFKTPGLRNVELTAPYFSSGGYSSLADVVDFYNRGGNYANANRTDVDITYQPLGLTPTEKKALVEFMVSLTDERVRLHKAPFDHPQLVIFNGHEGNERATINAGGGLARDISFTLPAVGAGGLSAPLPLFLGINQRTEGPSPVGAVVTPPPPPPAAVWLKCANQGGSCQVGPFGVTKTARYVNPLLKQYKEGPVSINFGCLPNLWGFPHDTTGAGYCEIKQ